MENALDGNNGVKARCVYRWKWSCSMYHHLCQDQLFQLWEQKRNLSLSLFICSWCCPLGDSRKYPYHPTGGVVEFRRGGGTLTWNSEGMGVCVSEFRGHGGGAEWLGFPKGCVSKRGKIVRSTIVAALELVATCPYFAYTKTAAVISPICELNL